MEWNLRSVGELAVALRDGEVSSVEVTEAAIAGIERDDAVINAICVPDFDRAREAARVPTRRVPGVRIDRCWVFR
jgi:amidase